MDNNTSDKELLGYIFGAEGLETCDRCGCICRLIQGWGTNSDTFFLTPTAICHNCKYKKEDLNVDQR